MNRFQNNYGFQGQVRVGRTGGWIALAIVVLLGLAVYWFFSLVYKFYPILSLTFIIVSLLVDRKVVFNSIAEHGKKFKESISGGVIKLAITALALPFISFGWMVKSIVSSVFSSKFQAPPKQEDTFTPYEEVVEEVKQDDFLELPKRTPQPVERSRDDQRYDKLFE